MFAGIDLGCNTGFAVIDAQGTRVYSETWHLGKCEGRSLLLYETNLYENFAKYAVEVVAFEDVKQFHRSRGAATVWGCFKGVLMLVCEHLALSMMPINVSTVKTLAGVPRPQKDDMEAAAHRMFKHIPEDDNEADALLIAEVARRKTVNK